MAVSVMLRVVITTIVGILVLCCISHVECIIPPYSEISEVTTEYHLPLLPYIEDELEPFIDGETVRVHYTGHHNAYTKKLNKALHEWSNDFPDGQIPSVMKLLMNLDAIPSKYRTAIRNNGGGYVNHNIYWSVMSPNRGGTYREPNGELMEDIVETYGSFENFKNEFTEEAIGLFGSGYVWLCRQHIQNRPELVIVTTANQDSPLTQGLYPILVIDVWEHAYYLKHQNIRPKYVNGWWFLVDWDAVEALDKWWNQFIPPHDEL